VGLTTPNRENKLVRICYVEPSAWQDTLDKRPSDGIWIRDPGPGMWEVCTEQVQESQ
jgi:hypothetical protein